MGLEKLTPREREIVGLLVEGHTSKSAAHVLGVSRRTVEAQRTLMMARVGAQTAAQLIWIVMQDSLPNSHPMVYQDDEGGSAMAEASDFDADLVQEGISMIAKGLTRSRDRSGETEATMEALAVLNTLGELFVRLELPVDAALVAAADVPRNDRRGSVRE